MSSATGTRPPGIYGVMAEFETPAALVEAAKQTYAAGYRKLDTFSPFPIEEAWEAIGHHDGRLSFIVLISKIEIIGRNRTNMKNRKTKRPIVPMNVIQSQMVG